MSKKENITTDKAPKAIGPYSQGLSAGDFVFLSGQIGVNPQSGKVEEEDVSGQLKQIMENIRNVLSAGNLDLQDIVKTTIFLSDMSDFAKVNEIYGSYFVKPYPARSTVEVSRLPLGVRIEIEAVAYCG